MRVRRHRIPFFLLAALVAAAVALVVVLPSGERSPEPVVTAPAGAESAVEDEPSQEGEASDGPEVERSRAERDEAKRLRRSFRRFAEDQPGPVGLAYDPDWQGEAVSLGEIRSGPAWSTIKPVLAALTIKDAGGAGQLDESDASLISAALRASDNDAALALWEGLLSVHGGPQAAAAELERVLSATGDSGTSVSTVGRDGFSPYGQTDWSLASQARFMAGLEAKCVPGSAYLLEEMSQVDADQRWGLVEAGAMVFKGGWGPDPDGGYFVRQMGSLSGGNKALGVAIAARPDDGQFATGVSMLGEVASWAGAELDPRTISGCPPGTG